MKVKSQDFIFLFLSKQTSFKKNEGRPRRVPGCEIIDSTSYDELTLNGFFGIFWFLVKNEIYERERKKERKKERERKKREKKVVSEKRAVRERGGLILDLKLHLTKIDS